jgi:hypothetical protein
VTRSRLALLGIVTVALAGLGIATASTAQDDPHNVESTLVFITATAEDENGGVFDSQATGFFVDREGNILTSNHLITQLGPNVIPGSITFEMHLRTKKSEGIPAAIVDRSIERDVLLLNVQSSLAGSPACIAIDRSPSSLMGKPIVSMGFPYDLPYVVSPGSINSLDGPGGTLITDAVIAPGQSGSPVLFEGRVVGIAKGQMTDEFKEPVPGQYIVVPITHAAEVLPALIGNPGCPEEVRREEDITAIEDGTESSIDILLVIDDSSSMRQDQGKFADAFVAYLDHLDAIAADIDPDALDYRICLTTTDVKFYKGAPIKWTALPGDTDYLPTTPLSRDTERRNERIQATIEKLGAEWSSDEQAINAVSLLARYFINSGCLRRLGYWVVIVLSDEDERSTGGIESLNNNQYRALQRDNHPEQLISTIRRRLPAKTLVWNAIIVEPDDLECTTTQDALGNQSFQGRLYAKLADLTGGSTSSICEESFEFAVSQFFENVGT